MTTQEAAIIRLDRFHAERRQRLANAAEARGVRIVTAAKSEQHYAIDPHAPIAYAVSTERCACRQWGIYHFCEHLALLESELGFGMSPEDIGWPGEKTVNLTDLESLAAD
jgi:hypothetical protein